MSKKWIFSVMLIAVIGLAGCGAPAEKEVAADATLAEEIVVEDAEEAVEEATGEVADEAETGMEEIEEVASEIADEPAQEQEEPAPATLHVIDFAAINAAFSGNGTGSETIGEVAPFAMTIVSEKTNNVSEIPDWLAANDLSLPMLGGAGNSFAETDENAPSVAADMLLCGSAFYDGNYIYDWTNAGLNIYDRNSGRLLHAISYQMDRWYFMGNCASLQDGILYMGYLYNGYAMPGTCYLLAYDLENDAVLW
ncbi:MAG: hypothetical protein IKY23_11680, partial [Lachnospiraceae bacterium]|nr:hypothetical protein [Lachnospiraceae bacterium]